MNAAPFDYSADRERASTIRSLSQLAARVNMMEYGTARDVELLKRTTATQIDAYRALNDLWQHYDALERALARGVGVLCIGEMR